MTSAGAYTSRDQDFFAMIIILFMTIAIFGTSASIKRCSGKEIELYNPKNQSEFNCWPWYDCPDGQGYSVKPGSSHPFGTKLECLHCTEQSYSNANTDGICLNCTDCKKKQEELPCTRVQNRKCGTKCISNKYYLNQTYLECYPCSECCGTADDEVEPQCLPSTPGTVIGAKGAKHCRLPVTLCITNSTLPHTEPVLEQKSSCDWSLDKLHISLICVVVLLICGFVFMSWKLWKSGSFPCRTESSQIPPVCCGGGSRSCSGHYCMKRRGSGSDTLLLKPPRQYSCEERLKFIPEATQLSDLPFDVEMKILKLDGKSPGRKNNWYHVGRKFGLSEEVLDLIRREDNRQDGSPTQELLGNLQTLESPPSLRLFVAVLQSVERHDVANSVCDWYIKNNNLANQNTDGILTEV